MSGPALCYGIFLDHPVKVGGGFQQSLTDLLWFRDHVETSGDRCVVFTTDRESVKELEFFGIRATHIKIGLVDEAFYLARLSGVLSAIQGRYKIMSPLERRLIAAGVRILYFPGPSKWSLNISKIPFIFTIFDVCHLDCPEFSEASSFGDFERREEMYRLTVGKAVAVVSNAQTLTDRLVRRYGMDPQRAVLLPFSPSSYLSPTQDSRSRKKRDISPGYLFYPAQFWPHKNHGLLIEALGILKQRGRSLDLVLCGSDKGIGNAVQDMIGAAGLSSQVHVLGFVDSADLSGLYAGAAAVVMPSYFGPTNLPPLEAWASGVPLVYPKAFEEQAGAAAAYFDFDEPESLADAIESALDKKVAARLIAAGRRRLIQLDQQVAQGRAALAERMRQVRGRLTRVDARLS